MSLLNVTYETALLLTSLGSLDTQADCAAAAELLRAELQPGDMLGRIIISLLERAAALPAWADYQQISAEAYAEFDQAVGIRMVPASNPVTGPVLLPFKVGGAL